MHSLKSKINFRLGITLGDPSGIGPEVTFKALKKLSSRQLKKIALYGDDTVLSTYRLKLPSEVTFVNEAFLSKSDLKSGRPNQQSGIASLKYLDRAVTALKGGEIHALVTAPVSKETIHLSQPHFVGHTEFLAHHFHRREVGMLFVAKHLKVIIATRHIPITHVPKAITVSCIEDAVLLTHDALINLFQIKKPAIAVCGLNPHAGEGGQMGREEIDIIIPTLNKLRERGINVVGPLAADTVFVNPQKKGFDTIVAMYHDQGLAPIKALYFNDLVNLTIGLPFIRTSPAHGTAFDIAGKNKADPASMLAAIKLAFGLSSSACANNDKMQIRNFFSSCVASARCSPFSETFQLKNNKRLSSRGAP